MSEYYSGCQGSKDEARIWRALGPGVAARFLTFDRHHLPPRSQIPRLFSEYSLLKIRALDFDSLHAHCQCMHIAQKVRAVPATLQHAGRMV